MHRDARDKLLTLVNRAMSPTDHGDEEARTAAVAACKLLHKHPELVAGLGRYLRTREPARAPSAEAHDPSEPSSIHPDAERLREWRVMMRTKNLREGHSTSPTICAACGLTIARSEPIVERLGDELATHLACAAWWQNFEPNPARDLDIAS